MRRVGKSGTRTDRLCQETIRRRKKSREEADEILEDLVYVPRCTANDIKAVPRFDKCLNALWFLFEQELPHVVSVMTKVVYILLYRFADASGTGFGSTFISNTSTRFRIGTCEKEAESNLVSWKEFENVVKRFGVGRVRRFVG